MESAAALLDPGAAGTACPDCAAQAAQMRLVAAAIAASPAPARRRDFKISAQDAARLRRTPLTQRLAGGLRPVGALLAASGLAIAVLAGPVGAPAGAAQPALRADAPALPADQATAGQAAAQTPPSAFSAPQTPSSPPKGAAPIAEQTPVPVLGAPQAPPATPEITPDPAAAAPVDAQSPAVRVDWAPAGLALAAVGALLAALPRRRRR
jgi:hypothetical protein